MRREKFTMVYVQIFYSAKRVWKSGGTMSKSVGVSYLGTDDVDNIGACYKLIALSIATLGKCGHWQILAATSTVTRQLVRIYIQNVSII